MRELLRRAISDIASALGKRSVWWALASEDIVDSHRRTMLGPVWPLLNYLMFCGVIVLILGGAPHPFNYTVYVATGLVVWLFISEILSTSASLFLREQSLIKGTVLPISTYVLRQTSHTAIRSSYALAGAIPLIIYSGAVPSMALLTVVPALLLVLITAPAVSILFGFAGVFFRDFQHIVTNAMRLLFFVTPVFWRPDGRGGVLGFVYHWNPLTHYIDIVRRPVVDGVVPTTSWMIAGAATVLLSAAALLVLGKYSRRVVFLL